LVVKAKKVAIGDYIYAEGELWRVDGVYVWKSQGETQYSYNHLDKREVAINPKSIKAVDLSLRCPKTGKTFQMRVKCSDKIRMANKAVTDVLYNPYVEPAHGNLVAGDAIVKWEDEDGQ